MNKCEGCGALLQNGDKLKEGYTTNLDNPLCNRCFRIRHYNDYQLIEKDNDYYISILKEIKSKNDLTLLVVDLFQIYDLVNLKPYLNSNVLLVLTKRDLLPEKLYEDKILSYFDNLGLDFLDKIIISSKNNYHFDELYDLILKYKKSQYVYVVGYTNAGKSTLINNFLKLYSDNLQFITTSNLPSTTLNTIEIKVNDSFSFIDTPGILVKNSLLDKVNEDVFKKIVPKKRIKPIVYQIKTPQSFKIDDFLYLKIKEKNNIVFYLSNNLKIERFFKDKVPSDLVCHKVFVKARHDILINGLGFIKFMEDCEVELFLPANVSYLVRFSVI